MSSKLIGSNKSYIEQKLPHLSTLITDLDTVVNESETIVITNKEKEFDKIFNIQNQPEHANAGNTLSKDGFEEKVIIDLVRIKENVDFKGGYDGICW